MRVERFHADTVSIESDGGFVAFADYNALRELLVEAVYILEDLRCPIVPGCALAEAFIAATYSPATAPGKHP